MDDFGPRRSARKSLWPLLVLLAVGCVAPEPTDYSALIAHMPRSILLLPPLDETAEGDGSYKVLPMLTQPLAERGYYVFPIGLVDRMMRENGLPTPYEMQQVPPAKLAEIFDPDAILYLTVHEWGSSYEVVRSQAVVSMSGRLVDTATGTLLWAGRATAVDTGGHSSGGLLGLLTDAIANQIVNTIADPSPALARQVCWGLFGDRRRGLLLGPLHPGHADSIQAAQSAQ